MRTKHCSRCREDKLIGDFYKNRGMSDGYLKQCKVCIQRARKNYRDKNPDARRKSHLKQKFSLTLEDWYSMWNAQEGLCAICSNPMTRKHRGGRCACVDHCHASGRVRGLLCNKCNRGLGQFDDNPAVLKAAILYLSRFHEEEE